MLVYRPNPVLLPNSLKQHPLIENILLEYLAEVVYGNNSIAPIRLAWDINDDPELRAKQQRDSHASPNAEEEYVATYNQFNHPPNSLYRPIPLEDKLRLLQENIPLSFDTFISGDKLVTIGPALPELDELLGQPRLLLRRIGGKASDDGRAGNIGGEGDITTTQSINSGKALEIEYFSESINYRLCSGRNMIYSNALKYSIATNLPEDVIKNPSHWQLEIRYKFNLGAGTDAPLISRENVNHGVYPTHGENSSSEAKGLQYRNGEHNEPGNNLEQGEQEFSHTIQLQANPFAVFANNGDSPTKQPAKSTLVTLQKDNPPGLIKQWCEYYYTKHQVQRIIIYNNGQLQSNTDALSNSNGFNGFGEKQSGERQIVPSQHRNNVANSSEYSQELIAELSEWYESLADKASHPVELYLVEWDYSYLSYFTQCQTGALNHCYWLVGDAASYILNFDLDEYLINTTARSLDNCLAPAISTAKGIILKGYESTNPEVLNTNIMAGRRHKETTAEGVFHSETENNGGAGLADGTIPDNNSIDNGLGHKDITADSIMDGRTVNNTIDSNAIETMLPANPKYLAAPKHWHLLTPHSILKKNPFPAPAFWYLLNSSKIKFTLAKYFYRLSVRLFYALQGAKRRIGLTELPSVMSELKPAKQSNLYFIHLTSHTPSWKWRK